MTAAAARDAPAWLVARPIAHRGLHDRARGLIENSLAAARAAAALGFAIECDVQVTADGDAVVFHDSALDRLTAEAGSVASRRCDALCAIPLAGSDDRIPSFAAFLALVGGRVPVICEVKSRFDRDTRFADRVADLAEGYAGPLALKSFDPDVIARFRARGLRHPLGIVAEADYGDADWSFLPAATKAQLVALLHVAETQPDFLSFRVGHLPHAVPQLFREALGRPVMAWTVRTPDQRQRAARWADQMVFEGFLP